MPIKLTTRVRCPFDAAVGLLVILCILPLLLSGGVAPRENMPPLVQSIMLGALTTYFVRLAQVFSSAAPVLT